MFCFHKYGEIKGGYQYCSKCGKAIVVPCNHKWEKESAYRDRTCNNGLTSKIIISRCMICGIHQKEKFDF